MKKLVLASASVAACTASAPVVAPEPPPAQVAAVSVATAAAGTAESPSPAAWTPRPKTLGMRTVIEAPLVVRADGTSSLRAAKDVVRVSDHYSACFVTRTAEVACWGVAGGGTWNGVAARDPSVGLHDVADVAINQTNACAATTDGSVLCWSGEGHPMKQALPAPAREILLSVGGRACALLQDGAIASTGSWKEASWERVRVDGVASKRVTHLLACDRSLVCGEILGGGAACLPAWDAPDVRRGVRDEQKRVVAEIGAAPTSMRLAMNDTATAYCAYSATEVRCFDAKSATSASISELRGITEVAVGWMTLGAKTIEAAGCAKIAGDEVRCWNLAEPKPALVTVR